MSACKRKAYTNSIMARRTLAEAQPTRRPRLSDVEKCDTCHRWHIREGLL